MAYVIKKASKESNLKYLPKKIDLATVEETLILDTFKTSDYEVVYEMMKDAVEEGQTYPQDSMTKEEFENYYLSHSVFVARIGEAVVGAFYVKPNYPGRSSHICNAGFLVHKDHRKKGIGEILFTNYLPIAKDLGYEGSFFNLVYVTNKGSVKLCRKLGFTEIGIVPKAGKLKNLGYVDAYQFYYDLTTLNSST